MATITKAELRNAALKKLGVLPSGQAASGEDAELVDDLIDAMFEELDDVLTFSSSAIPLWAREPLVDVTCAMSAMYFGGAPIAKTKEMAIGDFATAKAAHVDWEQRDTENEYY
jgi:hypothetical protein